jgi:polar amino acid transport system substrate-binding protein
MLKILKTSVIIIITLFSTYTYAEKVKLTNGEWAPFTSEKLFGHGLASHIVTEAFAQEDIEVEWGFMNWKRAFEWAKTGEWDGSIVWAKSPEREEYFIYSDPVIRTLNVFSYLKSKPFDWKEVEDLRGLIMGFTRGYNYGGYVTEAVDKNIVTTSYVDNDISNLQMLLAGRIDIFPIEMHVGRDLVNSKFADQAHLIAFHEKIATNSRPLYLIIPKKGNNPEKLRNRFNSGLKKITDSGRLKELNDDFDNGKYVLK